MEINPTVWRKSKKKKRIPNVTNLFMMVKLTLNSSSRYLGEQIQGPKGKTYNKSSSSVGIVVWIKI